MPAGQPGLVFTAPGAAPEGSLQRLPSQIMPVGQPGLVLMLVGTRQILPSQTMPAGHACCCAEYRHPCPSQ